MGHSLFKALGILNIKDMYNIGLLNCILKLKMEQFYYIFIIFWLQKTYLHVESHRYNFRHKRRVIISIPPREYQKRNTKYQLRELVLSTENRLLQ